MRIWGARVAAITMVLSGTVAVPAQGATDPTVAGLVDGLEQVADWYASDLSGWDRFGEPLPVVDVVPGEALGMAGIYEGAVAFRPGNLDATGIGGIEALADAISTDGPQHVATGHTYAVEAAPAGTDGLTVTVEITRTIPDAGFRVMRDVEGQPPVDVSSPGGSSGVPVELTYESTLTVHQTTGDDQLTEFYIDADPAPTARVTARIDGDAADDGSEPDPFVVGTDGADAAVGILDTTVISGSSLALDAELLASLHDTDQDGRLYFWQEADDLTNNRIRGEMQFAPADLVGAIDRSGSAAARLELQPRAVEIVGDAQDTATVTVVGSDLGLADVEIQTDATYDDVFADFLNINSTELLAGVGQLYLATSVLRGDPSADIDLPYLGLSVADLADPAAGLAEFVMAHTVQDNPRTAGVNEFGQSDLHTIGDLVTALSREIDGLDTDALAPVYDPDTELLDLPVHLSSPLGEEQPIVDEDGTPAGWLDLGDALVADAGIRGLKHDRSQPGQVRVRTGGALHLPWTLNLTAPHDCDDPSTPEEETCDDPATPAIEELADPPVYKRFGLRAAAGNEIEVLTEVTAPVLGTRGTAGWIEVDGVRGELRYATDPDAPAVAIDLADLPADGTPVAIHDYLQGLQVDDQGERGSQPTASRDLGLTGRIGLAVRDGDRNPVPLLQDDRAMIEVTWTDLQDADAADPSAPVVTPLDDEAELLRAYDFDPEHRTALYGPVVDTLDGLQAALDQIGSTAETEPFSQELALLGRPISSFQGAADALAEAIAAIRRTGPPATLQAFERRLQDELAAALGVDPAPGWLTWDLEDVPADGRNEAPDVVFTLDAALSRPVNAPLALELPATAGEDALELFAGAADGSSGLPLTVDETIQLGFPVAATDGIPLGSQLRVRATSNVAADVVGLLDNRSVLPAAIAGVDVELGSGGQIRVDTGIVAAVDGADDGFVNVREWLDGLTTTIRAGHPTCAPSVVPDGSRDQSGQLACASIPVATGDPDRDPATSLLRVAVDGLGQPATVERPDGLGDALNREVLDLAAIGTALDQAIAVVDRSLDATEWGPAVPFLGTDLAGGAGTVDDLTAAFDAFVATIAGPFADGATVSDVRGRVQQAINALPPALVQEPATATLQCTGALGSAPCTVVDNTRPATAVAAVEVDVVLGEGDPALTAGPCAADAACQASLPFDLGLPGLPLRGPEDAVAAQAGWRLDLGLGVDRDFGAFISVGDQDELSVTARANLEGTSDISLGIFGASVSSAPTSTGVGTTFTANLEASDGDRIPVADLLRAATGDLRSLVTHSLGVDAGIELEIAGVNSGVADSLPGLTTSLRFTHPAGQPFQAASTRIELGPVDLHLGQALGKLLGDPLEFVGDITEPVEPVLDFLTAPIPVLSDLSRKFGGGDVTMLTLADLFGGEVDIALIQDIAAAAQLAASFPEVANGDPNDPGAQLRLADGIVLDTAAAQAGRPAPTQAFAAIIDLEDPGTTVNGDVADDPRVADRRNSIGSSAVSAPVLDDPGCLLRAMVGEDCDIFRWTPDPLKVRFSYDQAFGPFFGILYVTVGGYAGADARFGLGLSTAGIREVLDGAATSAGPTFAILNGLYLVDFQGPEIGLTAGIKAGAKLEALVARAGAEGGVEATLGFDLVDPVPDGRVHITEVGAIANAPLCLFDVSGALKAFLDIYVEVGVGPASTRSTYRLAEIVLFEEIAALSDDCTRIPALADVIDDGTVRGQEVPVLRLNIGESRTAERGAFGSVTAETFIVRELRAPVWDGDEPSQPGLYEVSAFGHTQQAHPYTGRTYAAYAITFDAGSDADTLLFEGASANGVDGEAGAVFDPDAEPTTFTTPVFGDLGSGNDTIRTGSGNDRIIGGPGTDLIDVQGGSDIAHGDNHGGADGRAEGDSNGAPGVRDVLRGGAGEDWLYGEGGDDEIDGGPGGDHLNGNDGNDTIRGGSDERIDGVLVVDEDDDIAGGLDNDVIFGGPGDDRIRGEFVADTDVPNGYGTVSPADDFPEADIIFGEAGNDQIWAGSGDDEVYGLAGDDQIWGQGGSDTIEGDVGDDRLAGGPGDDTIHGQDGDDRIWGDRRLAEPAADDEPAGGVDTLTGGNGSDRIDGGGGIDVLHGGPGDDAIAGGLGAETIFHGDDGDDLLAGDVAAIDGGPDAWTMDIPDDDGDPSGPADTIHGDAGDDTIHGQGGGDELHAGQGHDVAFGNAGDDVVWGDGGDDELHGNAGNDEVLGGPGADLLYGRSGDDDLFGHAGADRLIGGSPDPTEPDTHDDLYGGEGTDVLLGDNGTVGDVELATSVEPLQDSGDPSRYGDDHLNGGPGRDALHGQEGDDDLYGGADEDQLFGEYGDDELVGGPSHDVLLGDRGTVIPAAAAPVDALLSGIGRWPGGAPRWTVELVDPNTGGEDDLFGRSGNDRAYGGAATDDLEGGWGDDHLEGNGGRDRMYGNQPAAASLLQLTTTDLAYLNAILSGQDVRDIVVRRLVRTDEDDLIGGSSRVNPEEAKLDEGEYVMHGNGDEDVIAGDNANIDGVVGPLDDAGDPTWAVDDVTGGRLRAIELLDREKSDATPIPLAAVSGGDLVHGDDGRDRIHGQGGTDILKGDADDDFVQGNQGRDLIEGNDGDDDLVGGSEFLSGRPASTADQGDYDAGDEIYGGPGDDVIAGDNAFVTRDPSEGETFDYVTTQLGVNTRRSVRFLDVDAPAAAGNSGPDVLSGGAGVDVLFGQDDRDIVAGGPGDDYMEGNGDQDWLFGDRLATEVEADPPSFSLPYHDLPDDVQDDLALPAAGTLVFPERVPFFDSCPLELPDSNGDCRSELLLLEGPDGPDGQDDQLGGSSLKEFRDDRDVIFGDGAQDVQLGDNGRIDREVDDPDEPTAYLRYVDYNPDTIVRTATRYDVNGAPQWYGGDILFGGTGDDTQYGQDGNDALLGQADNDDQYGELGDDWIDGGRGQDAQIGDRGVITNRLLGDGEEVSATTGGPMNFDYRGLRAGTLDRRIDLLDDGDGNVDDDPDPVEYPGLWFGGDDILLGGPGHDVMHGAYGNDVMNGEGGGDWMFGADGADVMWGGRGCVPEDPEDGSGCDAVDDPGADDEYVDILFGGHGRSSSDDRDAPATGITDADILDYRPRTDDPETPEIDPDPILWHLVTGVIDDNDDASTLLNNNHHHGIDWIYGGWDRDVLQGDLGGNGPEPHGDRLMDWTGSYNLYTRCNSSYGDDGDVRQISPAVISLLETMAYGTGVGASREAVGDASTSAYRELALVYHKDNNDNRGPAFPTTPGHFDQSSCAP